MLGVRTDFVIAPRAGDSDGDSVVPAPPRPQGVLKAEPVPEAQRPQREPIMRIIMPIVMVAAMVALVVIMSLSGRGMSPMMMILPLMLGMSMLMMIAPPERTGDIDEQRRVYLRHLDALSATARANAEKQRAHEQFHHPHPATLTNGVDPERLWERSADNPRALEVRIGEGVASLCTPIDLDDPGSTEDLDPVCAVSLRRTVAAVSAVHSIPIVVQLQAFRVVTLSGPGAWDLARSIVAQAIFFHGPELVGVVNKARGGACDWVKWTVHTKAPDDAAFRLVIADSELPIDAVTREETCTIVVAENVDDPVHQLADVDGIHLHADEHIEVITQQGPETLGVPDVFTHAEAEGLARSIAAYRRPSAGETATDNDLLTLLRMPPIDHINEYSLWPGRFGSPHLLTVPIGISEAGTPVYLDLKESAHGGMGPHGLCIGATGSGKSEILKTLVTALAVSHSPDELNFVLVDFKGGATFLGCEELPHTSAVITNLENEAVLVERMYDALSGELNRRQELLRSAGNFANVTDYTTARLSDRPDLAPLPSLVIVVDEFSELLGQHPDFADLFVAVGRLGRSLGVHLLLASQRLEEGKLRGLDSHLSYRIGLKTFSAAESRQVLGVTDAYQLPSKPGAGFLKGNSDQLERFQAAYVSGPLLRRQAPQTPKHLPKVQVFHGWDQLAHVPETPVREDSSTSVFREVVALTSKVACDREQCAHQVWLDPLPQSIEISHVCEEFGPLTCAIGIVDVPYHQRQDPLIVDFTRAGGHVAIAGGPQTGKSSALRTIVASLAATNSSADVAFYIVDAGNGQYADLGTLPHVAGIAHRSDPEKVRRTIDEVWGLVHNPPGYHVVLVLDGWHALIGADQEFDDMKQKVTTIASDGPAAGVHLLISTQRWSAMRAAVRDLVGNRLEFRLGEAMDSLIDRKKQLKLPAHPGHGLDAEGRMMLVAHTAKQDVAHIAATARAAGMPDAPRLKTLPQCLHVSELPQTDGLALGIGGPDLAPVGVTSQHVVVTGAQGCGKSTVLATLMHGITALGRESARMVVLDPRRRHMGTLDENMVAAYAPTTDAATRAVASTATTLRSRLPGPDISPEEIAARSWWSGPEIYLVIDDLDLLGDDTFRPLIDLLPHATDIGLHVIVARKFGGVARALAGRFLGAVKDQHPTVFIMDGTREEGALFGVRPGPQPPGRGTLVVAGEEFGIVHAASIHAEVDA